MPLLSSLPWEKKEFCFVLGIQLDDRILGYMLVEEEVV